MANSNASPGDPSKLPAHLRPRQNSPGLVTPAKAVAADVNPEGTEPVPGGEADGFNWRHFLKNWWFLLIAMPLILFVRFAMWSPFKIPSGSMEPELLGNEDTGDRVVVDLRAYHNTNPQRGDIAVFKSPINKPNAKSRNDSIDIDYVKRCVGVPGDRIVISGGDMYTIVTDKDGHERFELLRKPLDLQRTLWHTLYNFPYDFPWEAPDPLIKHGEWEVVPPEACTPAENLKSFHMVAPKGRTWQMTMRRSDTPMLGFTPARVVPPPVVPPPALPPTPSTPPPPVGPVLPEGPVKPAEPAPPVEPEGPVGPVRPPVMPPAPEQAAPAAPPPAGAALPAPAPTPATAPAGPAAPVTVDDPNAPPRLPVSLLSNRYLKTGDYWFRIPGTDLEPWRAHVRGSETALVVPGDIQAEFNAKAGTLDPDAKKFRGKRLFPIPLTWYAGSAEIESTEPETEIDRNIEVWRLSTIEAQTYRSLKSDDREAFDAVKRKEITGTSYRIGKGYGGNFSVNDLRIELGLDVKDWGRAFSIEVDEELGPDGRQVIRRYGLSVENHQARPWVEEFDAATGTFHPVHPAAYASNIKTDPDAPAEDPPAPLPLPATGKIHLALEHFDGTIRVVLYDQTTGAETASSGFIYTPAPRAMKQYSAGLRLKGDGTDVVFEKIKISRDLYYLWDEFKMMSDAGVLGNLTYRTSNTGMEKQLPDGYLIHRTDGLTEFDLKPESFPGDPESGYMMCGDNTVSSIDSRYFGPVERRRFNGKYWFTFWPPSRAMSVR